jgi:hypothetical protein
MLTKLELWGRTMMRGRARKGSLLLVRRNYSLLSDGRDYSLLLVGRNYTCLIDGSVIVEERQKSEVGNPTYNQKVASLPKEAPRLCRGGSKSLTYGEVVHRRNSPS